MIRKRTHLWVLAGLLLALGACASPKQARFSLNGCGETIPFDPMAAAWRSEAAPQLSPGAPGAWDGSDVLNPSVIRVGAEFFNFYSGFDGETWRTGLATSPDGVVWTKSPDNPLLEPDAATWEGDYIAANGTVARNESGFLHWYQAGERNGTQIGLARSSDGVAWTKLPEPVLELGPPGSWDESSLGDPYVFACGSEYYLYYLGQNRFGVQRLGVARSVDGVVWQKSHLNPLLEPGGSGEFDERGLGEPAVFRTADAYWMIYVGRNASEQRALGWARSADGLLWEKIPALGIIDGQQPWDAAVVCDPSVWFDGSLKIWFGGGDRASPDENLNGQIGLVVMESQPEGM